MKGAKHLSQKVHTIEVIADKIIEKWKVK